MGWALPQQLLFKKMPFLSPVLWRNFLNGDSLFSDNPSLCKADKNTSTTTNSNNNKNNKTLGKAVVCFLLESMTSSAMGSGLGLQYQACILSYGVGLWSNQLAGYKRQDNKHQCCTFQNIFRFAHCYILQAMQLYRALHCFFSLGSLQSSCSYLENYSPGRRLLVSTICMPPSPLSKVCGVFNHRVLLRFTAAKGNIKVYIVWRFPGPHRLTAAKKVSYGQFWGFCKIILMLLQIYS